MGVARFAIPPREVTVVDNRPLSVELRIAFQCKYQEFVRLRPSLINDLLTNSVKFSGHPNRNGWTSGMYDTNSLDGLAGAQCQWPEATRFGQSNTAPSVRFRAD